VSNDVEVNGRRYRWPRQPGLVVTVDGGDPRYFDDALERGLMPALSDMLRGGGAYSVGRGQMPSLTNPNNMSIVTGAPPSVHGIPGNHYLNPTGAEEQLVDPSALRAPTIHACLARAGAVVLAVTAKDKLRRLLGAGGVPSVSAERAAEFGLPDLGVASLPELIGRPAPGVYDWELSCYALEIGLAVHRRCRLDLLYVSLTDFVQHTHAPAEPLADRFFRRLDQLLGDYLEAGFAVAITADHGMNAKHNADGTPRVHYLSDVLERNGIRDSRVILPITDPYVRHHGALGSFAWVHVPAEEIERTQEVLSGLPGVEEVFTRREAAVIYQHPEDRIGDLSISANARTVLGKRRADHDLSQLTGGLRSHGGRHEQLVPIIVSHRLSEPYSSWHRRGVSNTDVHDLLLNGLASGSGNPNRVAERRARRGPATQSAMTAVGGGAAGSDR
jgi:phosphonoacetate hydrolase